MQQFSHKKAEPENNLQITDKSVPYATTLQSPLPPSEQEPIVGSSSQNTCVTPIPFMVRKIIAGNFYLFNNGCRYENLLSGKPIEDFFSLTNQMRESVRTQNPTWVSYQDFTDYANICHWMIRKLEYSFAIKAFTEIECANSSPLHILDLGCGVVPLCNFLSLRKHKVIGADCDPSAINFSKRHLNSFFGSNVDYRVASAESLPFPDHSFDVVFMVSVLEHISPGNDRLALCEVARVLKPNGHLIITFDVSPNQPQLEGESPWHDDKRRFGYPFTPKATTKLLNDIKTSFDVSSLALPSQFADLSWDDVHNFWRDNQAHDAREDATREYLAIGAFLRRSQTSAKLQLTEVKESLIEGQLALMHQLAFFQYHASQRLQIIEQLSQEVNALRLEIDSNRDFVIQAQKFFATTYLDELPDAKESLTKKDSEISLLRPEIPQQLSLLEKQLKEIRTVLTEKNDVARFFEQKYDEAEAKLDVLHATTMESQLQIDQLKVQILMLQTQYDVELDKLLFDVESKKEQISRLNTQLAQTEFNFRKECDSLHDSIEIKQRQIDRLLAETQEKDVQINRIKLSHDNDKDKMRNKMVLMQSRLTKYKAEQTQLLAVIEAKQALIEAMQRTVEEQSRIFEIQQEAHAKSFENSNLIAEARLRVIEDQQKALERLRHRSLRELAKRQISPQLGVLYQYPPKPIVIHQKYFKEKLLCTPPTVSIVTPSYNQGDFIERTIQSVLNQQYPKLEYIIQDGASSDETMNIIQKYDHQLKHYESKKDTGQTNALNLGFQHASGEIMAYLNSDDLLLPGSLSYVANYFSKHPKVDVLYGNRIIVDEYDQEVGRWILPAHDNDVLSWADYIPQETLFWRRSIWEKAGGAMDESFRFAMDWDLILRLREAQARFVRVPRYLGAFRIHPHQKTSALITELGNQEMNRLRERCNGRAVTYNEIAHHTRPYIVRHIIHSRFISLLERWQYNTVKLSFR